MSQADFEKLVRDNFLVIDRKKCFECGEPAECEHHVVPKILNGTKTLPLCNKCHGLVHDCNMVKFKQLQKEGIEKAKKAGKYKGRKLGTKKQVPAKALELHQQGLNAKGIAEELNISIRTVWRYIKESKDTAVEHV